MREAGRADTGRPTKMTCLSLCWYGGVGMTGRGGEVLRLARTAPSSVRPRCAVLPVRVAGGRPEAKAVRSSARSRRLTKRSRAQAFMTCASTFAMTALLLLGCRGRAPAGTAIRCADLSARPSKEPLKPRQRVRIDQLVSRRRIAPEGMWPVDTHSRCKRKRASTSTGAPRIGSSARLIGSQRQRAPKLSIRPSGAGQGRGVPVAS